MLLKTFNIICLMLIMVALPMSGQGQEAARPNDLSAKELQSLRASLEEAKKSLVEIHSELLVLRESAQFPPRSQVTVFMGMDKLPHFQLETVELKMDGVLVSRHVYTAQEKEAMGKGGLHRLYMGNVNSGAHVVKAEFKGKVSGAQEYSNSVNYNFRKTDKPTIFTLGISDFLQDDTPEMTIREDR